MSLALVHTYTVDIANGIPLIRLPNDLIGGDANAHQFVIHVQENGVDYSLTEATAVLYAVSSNRYTVINPATVSGNTITAALLEESCAVKGAIHILARVTQAGIKRTIVDIASRVREGNTGALIDPGEIITGIDDMLALVYALEAATADAAAVVSGITASAEAVSAETPAEAVIQVNETTGQINVHFKIPAGADGTPGAPGVSFTIGTVTTGAAGTSVIVENVGTASNPILNFTIPQGAAGAGNVSSVNGQTDVVVLDAADVGAVALSTYNANSILAATTDNTPAAVTVAEQTVVGRLTGGNIGGIALGIADNNVVQIDHDSVADDDFARFTANGLEGRSAAEVLSDIGAQAKQTITVNADESPALGTLANNTEYRCTDTTITTAPSMTFASIASTEVEFACVVVYKASGATAPVVTNNSGYTLKYKGDGVASGTFTPVNGTTYRMSFLFDGIYLNCFIVGVA